MNVKRPWAVWAAAGLTLVALTGCGRSVAMVSEPEPNLKLVEELRAGGGEEAEAEKPAEETPSGEPAGWGSLKGKFVFEGGAPAREKITSTHPNFPVGTKIFHQKFGYGKVITAQGDHLQICFEKAGIKKLLSDFVTKA